MFTVDATFKGPAYGVKTERTMVRCWNPTDAALLKEAVDSSLDHLRSWMPWAEHEPTELEDKIELLRQWRGKFDLDQDFTYGVFDPDETRVLGGTGLHTRLGPEALEIGYWIRADSANRRLATEVAAALTRVAFEVHQVDRVEIHCDPANIRSAAIPKKLGFIHEATLRRRVPSSSGELRDEMVWTLFKRDYPESPAARCRIVAYDAAGARIALFHPNAD
ncbi:MAG: GNAT family protein [Bacillota bacterium]